MNEMMINKGQVEEFIKRSKKELNKALKGIFSGQITLNFMLETMYLMLVRYPDLGNYIHCSNDMQEILSGRIQNLFYILCQHIIGVHRSKIIFLSNEDRTKLENDSDYKNELMSDVYKMIKLRHTIDPLIRDLPFIKGDKFLLFPVPYYIAVLETRFLSLSNKSKEMPVIYTNIANKSLAILSLLQDNFADCSYSTCRIIIEEYLRGNVFRNCPSAINEYYKFAEYELKKSIGYPFDDEFINKFKNRINKKEKNKINFLHYGWVDVIPHYHEVIKTRPYSFASLKRFVIHKFSDHESAPEFDLLYYYHDMCNGYAHGSINNCKYPILHYFEISSILVSVTVNAYYAVCKELNESTDIEGIDIIKEINKHYAVLKDAEAKKSTENFERYYKNFKIN